MMDTEKQFFPTSVIDETAYIMEQVFQTSLTGTIILTLEGEVRSQVVREALDACLNLNPKFKCILIDKYPSLKRWFRYSWEYRNTANRSIVQEVPDLSYNITPQAAVTYCLQNQFLAFLDITRHPPMHVILIRQPNQVTLLFTFHHAAVDGLGVILFLQQFIQLYEEIWGVGKKDDYYSPDFEAISQPQILFPWRHFSLRKYYAYLKHSSLLRREPPARVLTQREKKTQNTLFAAVREVDAVQLKTIRATIKKYHSTFNDYLLAALFHTIKKWNQQQEAASERIYINVPVNLRTAGDSTIGNIFSGFNISFRSELLCEKQELLKLIRKELLSLLECDMARTIVNLSWFLKFIPLKIKMLVFSNLPKTLYPTATLSNIGICKPNPTHHDKEGFHYMGPARISNISFLTSAVPWPQLVALTYNDRLAICLSVSRSHFSQEAAEQFLDAFVKELTQ